MLEKIKEFSNRKIVMAVIVAIIGGATFYAGCPEEGDKIIDQVQEVISEGNDEGSEKGMDDAGLE